MGDDIPGIIRELYSYFIVPPNPELWPEHLRSNPTQGHGLYSFYTGLQIGLQIAAAGLDTV